MPQYVYMIIAIAIIIVLAVIAIVTFVLYRKAPAPKGCENLEPDESLCCACLKSGCPFYGQYHDGKAPSDRSAPPPAASSKDAPASASPDEAPKAPKAATDAALKKEEKK
jgi:hypothetical protein